MKHAFSIEWLRSHTTHASPFSLVGILHINLGLGILYLYVSFMDDDKSVSDEQMFFSIKVYILCCCVASMFYALSEWVSEWSSQSVSVPFMLFLYYISNVFDEPFFRYLSIRSINWLIDLFAIINKSKINFSDILVCFWNDHTASWAIILMTLLSIQIQKSFLSSFVWHALLLIIIKDTICIFLGKGGFFPFVFYLLFMLPYIHTFIQTTLEYLQIL